jgi:two-component system chemotaxis response regulator CheY
MRGHEVVGTAATGEEALEKFNALEEKPDLIIMDHRMPGMGGLDAARLMMDMDPQTKIILVSADDNAVWEALKLGIVGMRKPINVGDLMSAIEVVVPEKTKKTSPSDSKNVDPNFGKRGLYIIQENDDARSLRAFEELIRNGYKGIVFTRRHPDTLTSLEIMKDVPVVWFTSTPVKDHTCVSPMNIQKMLIMIQSAFSESERSVALVRGFEYVLTNLQFDRALNLIQVLNDRVMSSESDVILFSLDLDILDERQKRAMVKEFEMIL